MDTTARPTGLTPRGEEARRRILDAAADLMHVQGIAATSVDEVLERARAGKGQFYHYFSSKGELVRAVLAHQVEASRKRMAPLLGGLHTWEGIRGWMDALIAEQRERGFVGGCPVGSMAAEAAATDEALRRDLADAFEAKRAFLREGLRRMKEAGGLDPGADPDALADFVLAALQGGLLLSSTRRDEAALVRALDHAYRHLRSHAARTRHPDPGAEG